MKKSGGIISKLNRQESEDSIVDFNTKNYKNNK